MTPRGGPSPPPAAPCGEAEAQGPPPHPLQHPLPLAAQLLGMDISTSGDPGRTQSMSAYPDLLHRPSLQHSTSASSAPNLTGPPPPPADFNPPADFSSELPLHGIVANLPSLSVPSSPPTHPPTLLPSPPTRSSPLTRIAFSPAVSPPARPSPAASPPTGSLLDDPHACQVETLAGRLQRPQLRSIQQISSDSVNISQRSSSPSASVAGGSSASASESGDVLALRRDELVSNILSAEDEWTRRSASSAPPSPTLEETEEFAGRPRSMSRGEETHAWDSVWPAPNVVRRAPGFDLPGPSRFPMAPMSPYVTPAFSPAVVQQAQTAATAAWSLSTSPSNDSERPGSSSPGQRPSLPHAFAPRHSSFRHSLQFEEVLHGSNPPSPRPSSLPNSPLVSPVPDPKPAPPRSRPIPEPSRRSPSPPSSSPSLHPSRSPAVTTSPASSLGSVSPIPLISGSPPLASPGPRPAALVNHFPELVPPFISRRELSPRLTRRLSETAIVRRPDASLLLAGQEGASSSITTHNEPDRDMDDDELLLSPRRPGVPRRAKSAQDAHGGTRSVHPALPLSVPAVQLTSLDDDVFEMDDDEPEPQITPAYAQPHVPSPLALGIVDEGDCLPTESAILEMDVTFDDEGLNALERIFLLSRSEYPFHRAYVARVLGDLLDDVDPCESVEYVLPLITAFSFDEDETVKEAFAEDLHRILWYYFTTCQLVSESPTETPVPDALPESVQRLENMHPTQPLDRPQSRAGGNTIDSGLLNHTSAFGVSSKPGNASTGDMSTITMSNATGLDFGPSTEETPETSLTPSPDMGLHYVDKYEDQPDGKLWEGDKLWEGVPEIVSAPELHVGFFRPLLGTMLLSHNQQVANPTRDGIIALVSRLRGGPVEVETWGTERDHQETQVHLSQTGPHLHHGLPFGPDMRQLVEQELLYGIVLGMGTLSTEVPDSLFNDTTEVVGDDVDHDYEAEMYRLQMIQEATLGRALSLSFIGAMSELYSPEEVLHYGFIDEVIRGQDGDVSTRAEAALAIGKVVRAAPPEEVGRLLDAFLTFTSDKNSTVLQSACSSLASLCKRAPSDEYRRDFAVTAMKGFMAGNENVQYAALEALGEVIYTFANDPLGPPPELLQIFCEERPPTTGSEDCDWTFLTAFNLPGVCLTVGPDRWGELRELYHRIAGQAGTRVLRTIAASLHELANILHPEQVAHDVLPVYRKCLSYGDNIRECIFEHVDVLIARLPEALGWECFMDLSTTWERNMLGGWRAREQLALHIPSFLETFHRHSEVAAVLGMMRSALLDPFAAVRDAATVAVPRSFEILGRSMCSQNVLNDMLLDLGFSSSYRQRLTFVRCLREFIRPPPNRAVFEKSFMPSLMRLSQDVVDVRLGLAKAIADLFIVGAFYGDRTLPVPQQIRRLARVLAEDDSPDVRAVLSDIGVERWQDVSSEQALAEELATSDNPSSVEAAVEQVMDDSSPARAVVEQKKGLHERALLPSPLVNVEPAEEPEEEEGDHGENPFAASFGRAAAGVRR